jgi:hypothetical protein
VALAAGREPQHVDAVLRIRETAVLLVRLRRDRHEEHAVEARLLPAALREQQVPDMHRIETAAVHPDPHGFLLASVILPGVRKDL